mgnify:CR=1 FL=1
MDFNEIISKAKTFTSKGMLKKLGAAVLVGPMLAGGACYAHEQRDHAKAEARAAMIRQQAAEKNIVLIDEAYVDFGTETSIPLIKMYDNLLVIQTFSKSRSLAGMRLGYGIANKDLIADLNALRFSTNPYNLDRIAMAAGIASLEHDEVNREHCRTVMETREYTVEDRKSVV